jgi:hypothetical protein
MTLRSLRDVTVDGSLVLRRQACSIRSDGELDVFAVVNIDQGLGMLVGGGGQRRMVYWGLRRILKKFCESRHGERVRRNKAVGQEALERWVPHQIYATTQRPICRKISLVDAKHHIE